MNEITSGLRSLEMHERQAWLRQRAEREMVGTVSEGRRRFRRTVRRAA